MRILLISDSHANNEAIDNLIRLWPDVELYLHAGDSEVAPQMIYPFRTVRGNCDYTFDMQDELIIPTPFGNVLMRHKADVSPSYLKKNNIKLFIYGHTHKKECYKKNDIAYVNPGAISYARDGQESYAILENHELDIDVTYYSLATNEIIKKYRIYYLNKNNPTIKDN